MARRQNEKVGFNKLLERQKGEEKGWQILYENFKMADYLLPECQAKPEEKGKIFLIRSEMDDYPSNFGNKTKYELGCPETWIKVKWERFKLPEIWTYPWRNNESKVEHISQNQRKYKKTTPAFSGK